MQVDAEDFDEVVYEEAFLASSEISPGEGVKITHVYVKKVEVAYAFDKVITEGRCRGVVADAYSVSEDLVTCEITPVAVAGSLRRLQSYEAIVEIASTDTSLMTKIQAAAKDTSSMVEALSDGLGATVRQTSEPTSSVVVTTTVTSESSIQLPQVIRRIWQAD